MDRIKMESVASAAASERGCSIVELAFNDDDNIFEITIDKADGDVQLADCEHVHRAILAAFDRNVEDYALTVGSEGLSSEEADRLLGEIDE